MNIIPVLDIKGGKVVRGQGGRRDEYSPLRETVLLPPSKAHEPNLLLHAFEDNFGLKEFYVADLDSIEGKGDNVAVLESMRETTNSKILLDSGIRKKIDLDKIPDGFSIVIASETLMHQSLLVELAKTFQSASIWFSLDLKGGDLILPACSDLPRTPLEAAVEVASAGINGLLAIELDRVGTRTGPNFPLIQRLAKKLSLSLYWGGGVRDLKDLRKLRSLNCSGCLVASALHSGSITAKDLASLTNS
ncbi:MAG: HisA/HisF-related TIM barrel protein [Candidatus Hodarchaeales archaeon]|jgi:phosphoribosylformimino-5-aminoimidazole carboxamide ribotide isomerase